MRKLFLLSAVIALTATSAFSQLINRCGTTESMNQLFLDNPGYREQLQQIDEFTNQFIANNPEGTRSVVNIPVVVHVVYNTTTENISDAQVLSQIEILNEDFRRLNADANETPAVFLGIAADCEINFCLAAQDPSGNATNGITRTSTTKTSFSSNNNVKFTAQGGKDIWDRSKYLNIWVCDLGASLLGYAQFPGGPANTDGVVIHYKYTGDIGTATPPYQYGRSATHEVGHWLNLYHIWGDDGNGCNGSDQVADTPNQANETYGCPLPTIRISCTNGPNGDMYSNYMDYTDDGCMNVFSTGQKNRMQALFGVGGSRVSITTSNGCVPPGGGTCNVPAGLNATAITSASATLNWGAATGAVSYNVQYRVIGAGSWTSTTSATTSKAISGLSASTQYEFQVQTVCASSSSAFSPSTNFTTSAPACTDVYEPNNTKGSAKPIAVGVDVFGLINVGSDKDFLSFANTVSQPNMELTLSSLPANYHLDLYDPSGVKIFASKTAGTADEVITNNTAVVGTYVARVYPANTSTFNASDCYTLNVQLGNSPFRTVEMAIPAVGGEMTSIYPNPSNGNMVVEYSSISNSSVQLIAYDMMGRVVFSEVSFATEGTNAFNVNINNISTGIYMFEVRNGSEASRMKFSVAK